MISEEIQLIKQNIYDLLHNTRINKKAYLIILIGLFFTYFVGNAIINTLSIQLIEMYYLRYIFKLMGVCLVIELSRRRLHDFGLSGKWIYLWLIISCSIYGYYMYDLFVLDGLNIVFFEEILLREVGVNDTLRMYKNDDIRMYNFNCITDTIVEVITTCNTYTLLTVHLL